MEKSTLSILILFVIITLSQNVNAQLGIKAGVNFSSLDYFDDDFDDFNEEFVTGYQIGAVYHAGIGDKLSFQAEAAFHTRGGKISVAQLADIETNYNYLNLVGLINYNLIGNNDGISLRLTAGVFGGYALSGTTITSMAGNSEEADVDFDDERFDRSNVGYVFGVGVKLNDLLVSLRASFGVTELGSFDSGFGSGQTTYKSREFSLVGIYLF